MRLTLACFRDHFGATLGHFGINLGSLGDTLGSLWDTLDALCGDFGIPLRSLGSLWGHFACMKMALKTLWAYEELFSKNISFPALILMILCISGIIFGPFWVTLGALLAYEGDLGSRLGPFGTTSGSL